MTHRDIYRGDDYIGDRPVLVFELVTNEIDPNTGDFIPLNMAGSTIRTTFKLTPTDLMADPTDSSAPIKADIAFSREGIIEGTPLNWSLPEGGTAEEGVLYLVLDRVKTASLPIGTQLRCDVQVTDSKTPPRVITLPVLATVEAIDGYTNRV